MEHADGHRYFEGLAVAHVLGGLDDSEGRVFRSHLLECSNCRARVGELRAIAHDLADVERDERRVRAAQAIETKRRESDDEVDEVAEPLPSERSSRISVVVGLVLIIGLSLWNFTLRSALTLQEERNRTLTTAGVIAGTGTAWPETQSSTDVDGAVTATEDQFLLSVGGLEQGQRYGIYIETDSNVVAASYDYTPTEGRIYTVFRLPDNAERITVTNPLDSDGKIGAPGDGPTGEVVFQARRPVG